MGFSKKHCGQEFLIILILNLSKGEPYWIKKGERPLHTYPYLDDLREAFNSYKHQINKDIEEIKLKKDDLIDRVQTLINSDGDNLKIDLKKETNEFVKTLIRALYFKEKQQDFFSSQQSFLTKHNFTNVCSLI